jgi:hypothetical protein
MNGNLKVIFHGDFSWDEMGMIILRHQTLRSMAGKIILNWGVFHCNAFHLGRVYGSFKTVICADRIHSCFMANNFVIIQYIKFIVKTHTHFL